MGGYLDVTTGLYHFGERYYDPTLGRFLQMDPVQGGSCNVYDYACGDPINYSDRSGKGKKYNECRQAGRGKVDCFLNPYPGGSAKDTFKFILKANKEVFLGDTTFEEATIIAAKLGAAGAGCLALVDRAVTALRPIQPAASLLPSPIAKITPAAAVVVSCVAGAGLGFAGLQIPR